MRKPTNKEKIQALREAKQLLGSNDYDGYICLALLDVSSHLLPAARELREYISNSLSGGSFSCLEDWLKQNRPELPLDLISTRMYRIQWINWMIRSLEGKP